MGVGTGTAWSIKGNHHGSDNSQRTKYLIELAGAGTVLVLVTGDLNDFQFGEPGEGADHPVAILEGVGGGVPLTNLVNVESAGDRFSFVFNGNSQVLDHMLVSPKLLKKVRDVDFLHFNAGYPSSVGRDATTTIRAADHDPLEGRFKLKLDDGDSDRDSDSDSDSDSD